MDENHPLNPITTYAAGKVGADKALEAWVDSFNLDAFIVRPFNNYGPRQNSKPPLAAVIPVTMFNVLNQKQPEIWGDGSQSRDFIYVHDTVDAIIKVYDKLKPKESVNISTDNQISIKEVIEKICKLLKHDKNNIVYKPKRQSDVECHNASNKKLKSLINYQLTPFSIGLRKTVNWYLNHIGMKYKVGIIGCGGIFPRHIEAIEANSDFELVSVCDIQKLLVKSLGKRYKVPSYTDYKELIVIEEPNFIVIATPNSLHKEQAIFALEKGCDVLIEKPVSFNIQDVKDIQDCADRTNQKVYCVLQVRLNPTVSLIKEVLNEGLLGEIRGFSFTQRWQRPLEYFSGWRGEPDIGGGILYETGIHYLDILQYLIGNPKEVLSTKTYITKHKEGVIEDTVYSLVDYGNFGGTIESTIASEPHNIESSITLMGSNGYIKVGGKST